MDYEKEYKGALERAKNFYKRWDSIEATNSELVLKEVKEIFPELAESKDEKVRKAILELVKQSSHILNPMNQKSMIAWLEKKELKKIVQKPKIYDSMDDLIADALIEEIENSDLADSSKHNRIFWIKSHRQNPAWSEDDEIKLKVAVAFLKHPNTIDDNKGIQEKVTDWLKSLKERYIWKPSEEQMDELRRVAFQFGNSSLSPHSDKNKELVSLYNDLKKL